RRRNSRGRTLRMGARADRRDVGRDPDLVADEDTAGLERLLPAQPELATAERAARLQADPILALWVFGDAVHGHLELNRVCLAVHRQLTLDAVVPLLDMLDPGRLERDLRVLLDVEEIGRAKVVVATRLVGVDRGRLDRSPHLRLVVVGRRLDRAGELAETAAHSRD